MDEQQVAETASNREKQQPPLIGIRFQVKPATLLIPIEKLLLYLFSKWDILCLCIHWVVQSTKHILS